jgi:acyl-CoA thioesterase-1
MQPAVLIRAFTYHNGSQWMPHYLVVILCAIGGLLVLLLVLRLAIPVFVVWYVAPVSAPVPGTTRIACVGDSITYGTLVRHRRENCYPAQLERLLGKAFSVRNFGANGRAVQRTADLPYWNHEYFRLSTAFDPDIVLIMLGTNDSRTPNWKGLDQYLQDYRDMLTHYRSLPSKPIVYALTPPTLLTRKGKKAARFGMIKEAVAEMTAGITKLAREFDLEVIDINAATSSRREYFSFDGVHANGQGATYIAGVVYAALRVRQAAPL